MLAKNQQTQQMPAPGAALQPLEPEEVLSALRTLHPDADCQLNFETPLQLLVATILMAQCSFTRVNAVTPILFSRYKSAEDYMDAPRQELEQIVRPTGFFRQKARYVQGACHVIVHDHNGEVPRDMELLIKLPGVSRKTANIVLGEAFGARDGVIVDTNVIRVVQRLGLSDQRHPKQIEQDLMAVFPREQWLEISHLLSFHGQRYCHNRRPACVRCGMSAGCPGAEL